MPRIVTKEAAAAKPVRIAVSTLPTGWLTILEAPDFSVPDTSVRWPDERDPQDADRRIQPGFALIEAPLMFHNTNNQPVTVEIRTLTEDGLEVPQAMIEVPAQDTYMHPAPGQRLLKARIETSSGDRLQVKASTAGTIHLTSAASEGSAEQHQPQGIS